MTTSRRVQTQARAAASASRSMTGMDERSPIWERLEAQPIIAEHVRRHGRPTCWASAMGLWTAVKRELERAAVSQDPGPK